MRWSEASVTGITPPALRSHTSCLSGSKILIFGGSDQNQEVNDLYSFDTETMFWYKPRVTGTIPEPVVHILQT